METIFKTLVIAILVVILWRPFWHLVRSALENAHSRLVSFLGKVFAVTIIALFILLVQWLLI
ncbi:hypothetical protein A2108_01965 [Candidatus Wolfebacteria bacterium GWA1_42_9]|uniref:Uncharacterized protein n=1 Tax=Candidatus Wolfebacteria bacterium GWA1_42_9 TaxID=1802553 RepID=A0A1F8DMN1_9BACT|nr:MAG: hypothetical protein A2108_01965 [Candidatus Wolfebacteria bacterium GWA1_42_9]